MKWMLNDMRLIITGGGTGGHVYPGIAVARELISRDERHEVLWVGAKRGLESKLVADEKFNFKALDIMGLKGKGIAAKAVSFAKLMVATVQSLRLIQAFKPDVVLGVGGYASGPMSLASLTTGRPLALAEQNAAPGMTNRMLARFAKALFLSWPSSERFFHKNVRSILAGNPVMSEFFTAKRNRTDTRLNILVIGGSQGAGSINRAMAQAAPLLDPIADKISIVHQTGDTDIEMMRTIYKNAGFKWEAEPFFDDMPQKIANADLVISRSGAGAVTEICSVGRAAVYVPYPYAADDHQTKNAESAMTTRAAIVVADKELNGSWITRTIDRFEKSREQLAQMGERAKKLARPEAAKTIVDELLAISGETV